MALLRSCCCWLSLRKGSYACGVYTLIFYTVLVATGICHVNSVLHSPVGFTLILLLLTFSGLCVIFSGVLLLGLYLDNRLLLIPWLAIVSMTTLLDIVLSIYFIADLNVNGFVVVMYVVDYALCSVNVYCVMCVLSLYQEYAAGRTTSGQASRAPLRGRRTAPQLPVVSAHNRGNSRRGDSDRSTSSRIASRPSRRISCKAALPLDKGAPDLSTADADAAEAAATSHGAGKVTNSTTRIAKENLLMPAVACGSADDVSSGLHSSTVETSLQPSGEEVDLPENVRRPVFNSGADDGQLKELNNKLRIHVKP